MCVCLHHLKERDLKGRHSQYIKDNLELLQEQCKGFSACTQEVYSAENYHRILAGDNIRLINICGLIYANGGGEYTTLNKECSVKEREAIRQIIGQNLQDKFKEKDLDSTWQKFRKCVEKRNEAGEKAIKTVCREKYSSSSGKLCEDEPVNILTRNFFNQELEKHHCRCEAINSISPDKGGSNEPFELPDPVRIAIGGGVFGLLVVLIIAVVVLFLRHRKTTRKLKEHRMRYVTAAATGSHDEPSVIYQEISDLPTAPKPPSRQLEEGKLLPHGYELDVAPSLPERYVKGRNLPRGSQPKRPPSNDDDRPHSYMEPLADPMPGPSGLGGPPPTGSKGTLGRSDAAGQAGKGGDAYSLAKNAGESHLASTPYSLAKPVDESQHDASASGGYSLAKRLDQSPGNTAVKGSESSGGEGTYFDTIKLNKGRAEDEFGYAKLRCSPGSIRNTDTERESSTPQYFELEAEGESSELRNSEINDLTSSTKL